MVVGCLPRPGPPEDAASRHRAADGGQLPLVERQTRYLLLGRIGSDRTTAAVCAAIATQIQTLPEHLARSLTWDRGMEILYSARTSSEYASLERELDALRILRNDRAVADAAMSAFRELAERGDGYHRVPLTDALIAAAAAEHGGAAPIGLGPPNGTQRNTTATCRA